MRPGDTLWDLAEQELGDPRRWTDLFGASRCTTQSGGVTLTDPDRILPGWVVRVPTTSGGPPSPACGQ